MSYRLHVAPTNDGVDHVIALDAACPCQPTESFEGTCAPTETHQAECACTFIHRPAKPLTLGHDLRIRKIKLFADGSTLVDARTRF